jgi:hypothetical protein
MVDYLWPSVDEERIRSTAVRSESRKLTFREPLLHTYIHTYIHTHILETMSINRRYRKAEHSAIPLEKHPRPRAKDSLLL